MISDSLQNNLRPVEDLSGFDIRDELRVFRNINERQRREINYLKSCLKQYIEDLESMYELWHDLP